MINPEDMSAEEALYQGSCYYDEGMGYTDPADHEKRVDCFRAAEILYRHAAGQGNPVANLNLGYVYSYDRCEGDYWSSESHHTPFPREERAFECFSIAAEAGIAEACYKLGDLYKHGIGCTPNATDAYRWYAQASKLASKNDSPEVLGSIMLRLGSCHEEGFGCEQSFSAALQMYNQAIAALEVAVDAGETWYEKSLASARAGAKRCTQEINL